MTSFSVHDGKKSVIDDEVYDILWSSIEGDGSFTTDTEKEETPTREQKRKTLNDNNNTKNRENGYFRDYFQTKLLFGWTCDRCGACISTKTNKYHHYQTQTCKTRQFDRMQGEARNKMLKSIMLGYVQTKQTLIIILYQYLL